MAEMTRRERADAARMRSLARLDELRETPGEPTVMNPDEKAAHRVLDQKVSARLRDRRANLPSAEVEEKLLDLIDLAQDLQDGLEELGADHEWTVWLSAGGVQGKDRIRGPWKWFAHEFLRYARNMHENLDLVADSFEYRCLRNKERAETLDLPLANHKEADARN